MRGLLDYSDFAMAQYLSKRSGMLCTMCDVPMVNGYCANEHCRTYPEALGSVFITRFVCAIDRTHHTFKKRTSLKPTHSKTVSGGRVESKRRKH